MNRRFLNLFLFSILLNTIISYLVLTYSWMPSLFYVALPGYYKFIIFIAAVGVSLFSLLYWTLNYLNVENDLVEVASILV